MTATLRLAEGLALPLEAVTERIGWLGRPGGGKTYGAMKLAELMIDAGAQVIALDPVGKWYGLRLAADGKKPGIPIPVFGGLHGDVPLEPTGGKLVADLIADRGISCVLDVSQFESDADKARFAGDFMARFYFRRKAAPAAVHIFCEEFQEFAPQHPDARETVMLHHFVRAAKLGRNFGLGFSFITQRPQEVNKKALNLVELLLVFQMTGIHERKTVQEWIANKGLKEDIGSILPTLGRGKPHVWSPAWLQLSKVVSILPRRTFDASSTPKVGAAAAAERALAPIDIEQLRTAMQATIVKAKAEDPRELRREIAQLKQQLADTPKAPPAPVAKPVEVPVLGRAETQQLERAADKVVHAAQDLVAAGAIMEEHWRAVREAIAKLGQPRLPIDQRQPVAREVRIPVEVARGVTSPTASGGTSAPSGGELPAAQQRILDAAKLLHSLGIDPPDVVQLALFAGLTAGTGHWRASIGALRTGGFVVGLQLTHRGHAYAKPAAIASQDELHRFVLGELLDSAQRRVLKPLITIYPGSLSIEEAAAAAELEPGTGHWRATVGRLRSLGLVTKKGALAALPVLFLEGR